MAHEFRLLGPWELSDGHARVAVPGSRLRILLTSLVLSANQTVGLDTLAEQLWPELPPLSPRRSLHTYIGRLRQLLGRRMILTQPGIGYQIRLAPDAVDLHRFRNLLSRASQADSAEEELPMLRAALSLWRGDPFADLSSSWLDRDVAPRLTEEWFAATRRRIELELVTEAPESVIAELRTLTDRHPTREALWQQLITALHRAGRRTEALDAFRRACTILRDELGIEPSEPLARLRQMILLGGNESVTKQTPRQLPDDIATFTGREQELATLDRLLAETEPTSAPTIVTIGGAPGVGKTTLAVHWAHRMARRYADAQLYLDLRGHGLGEPLTPSTAAEMLLRALGVDSAVIPSELDERSAWLRSRLSGLTTMIVLDNARDAEQVRPLLPGGNGLVIVTSRSQLRGLSIRDGAHRMPLQPLRQRRHTSSGDPSRPAAL